MKTIWNILYNSDNKEISVVDKLLDLRKINSDKKKEDFLNPLGMKITSPYAFLDMEKAVGRIVQAISKNEKIVIYGDFDADGVTSTVLLYKTLKQIGANVDYYLPNRLSENHGMNKTALIKLIAKQAKLFITVDCGISNIAEVAFMKSFGVDTIITDHHEGGNELPDAYAILNPKVINNLDDKLSIEEIEYLTYLAGVGVAFKLACALLEKFDKEDFVNELIPILTVGTIADIVPLIGENRCFVSMGLNLLKNSANKAISKLLKSINYTQEINSECIAFYVAPRINSAGRLDSPDIAFDFLNSDDDAVIDNAIEKLNEYNAERQKLCDDMYNEAIEMLKDEKNQNKNSIVLYKPNWHVGIIGIVASKLVETFYKPAFLICGEGDILKCSSRGVKELNIYEIISQLSDCFESFGGHKLAGGFAFDKNKVSFDIIRTRLNEVIDEFLNDEELNPSLNIDVELNSKDLTLDLIEDLQKFEPFGAENEVPVFGLKNVDYIDGKLIGKMNNHLKLQCKIDDKFLDCVFWNQSEVPKPKDNKLDIAFYLKLNEFNGEKKLQFDIRSLNYDEEQKAKENNITFLDHRQKNNIYDLIENYIIEHPDKIKIYAKSKNTIESLATYPFMSKSIVAKPEKTPQIMFFDYPCSFSKMNDIILSSHANIVHLMKKNFDKINVSEFIKTLSGMLKYIYNNKNGDININEIADFLNVDSNLINITLNLFCKSGFIAIENNKVVKMNVIELSKIQEDDLYSDIENQIENINKFNYYMQNENIEKISSKFCKFE